MDLRQRAKTCVLPVLTTAPMSVARHMTACVTAAVAIVGLGPAPALAAKSCYTFALPAMSSPVRAELHWAPFVQSLERRSGVCLRQRVSESFVQFDARLSLGEPDFAMPPPSSLIHADKLGRYTPLVTSGLSDARGVLVVRRDSGFERPADLSQAGVVEVGVASPTAHFLSLAPQRALRRAGVRCRAIDFGNPSNVLRAVALGRVPVGASLDMVLNDYDVAIRAQLRVIFATEPHLRWPIAAHARVPAEVSSALTEAVSAMANDESGRSLLRRAHLESPVRTSRAAYVATLAGEAQDDQVCDSL